MQVEGRRKLYFPGPGSPQDHGGLHVCHSCRWRFPNSHPSARQRRAHRRHCGKIDGFPLIPSHHEDGGRSDGEENDANAGATAAPPDPHSGKISEVDLDRKKSLITSAGCTVETSCETGEGRKRSGPVGVYGVEALVEILSGNPVDPYADKTFEFPDVAHGKEIRGVDVVEHSKKLDEPPTTGTLASNVQGTRLFAEIGDNGGDASSLSPAAPPLDTYVNETSAEEDENVLNEFLAEIELAVEERLRVGSNFNLESPSIEAQGVYAMDTETRLFKRNNSSEIGVLSNPTSDTCRQETAPIIDISMNLKTVSLESTHAEESDIDGKNSRLGSNSIVPVSFSENEMGANAENNVPDEALVETKSAAVERPWEEYNFRLESFLDGTGKGNDLIHAELRSLDRNSSSGIEVQPQLSNICGEEIGNQGTDTPMTLEEPNSEATVVQELDKDVESTSTLVINPLDRSVNGMSSKVVENLLDESLFETEPCLEEVPWEKTILEENSEDHSLPVFQLLQDLCQDAISDISREHFSSHEEIKSFFGMPVDEKTSFTAGDHLKDVHTGAIQSESVLSVSGKVNHEASKDQGLPEADTTLETAVTCVEFRPADPGLEELKLGNTLNEAVQNLVPFISCGQADGDYAELENEGSRTIENEADENKNIADEDNPADGEASHDLSDELTSEEGSTYSVFKFLIQAKGDKNDGHVDVENSGNDQDGASYHQESDKESILKQSDKMIDPEFTTDHFHLKSPCSQDGEECQVERNQSLTGSVSMLNGSSQTSSPVNMGSEVRYCALKIRMNLSFATFAVLVLFYEFHSPNGLSIFKDWVPIPFMPSY
ncbi:unnamed protein product [Spirodela intermedia]|uniref:Uncharacterized protein n=1 Tax=Spirodela intermedia TaxID=51605 RepID=A0A7I8L515_SPIIN|nr:unnamed protein product [Spirodela intermedia]